MQWSQIFDNCSLHSLGPQEKKSCLSLPPAWFLEKLKKKIFVPEKKKFPPAWSDKRKFYARGFFNVKIIIILHSLPTQQKRCHTSLPCRLFCLCFGFRGVCRRRIAGVYPLCSGCVDDGRVSVKSTGRGPGKSKGLFKYHMVGGAGSPA